jgi:hypothetical protein
MDFELPKGSIDLLALMFVLNADPVPYRMVDKGETVMISFSGDVSAARAYQLGIRHMDLACRILPGVLRSYRGKWRVPASSFQNYPEPFKDVK